MDCELAREQLDVIHPDGPELADAEVQGAVAHVEQCPDCAEVVKSRHAFDRELGRVLRDIPVPSTLRSRLVLAVTEAESSQSSTQPAPRRSPTDRLRSRRWTLSVTTAAAGLLVLVGAWKMLAPKDPPTLTFDTVREWCAERLSNPADVRALPALKPGLPQIPQDGRWAAAVVTSPRYGADMDDDGIQDAAVYALPGNALLVVMGPNRVSSPPTSMTWHYSGMPHVAWKVGDQVYLVFAPGGRDQLKALLDHVYGRVG